MKYYSEILKKFFDSEKDCIAAEKEQQAKLETKESEYAKLKEEKEKVNKAYELADKLYNDFRNHVEEFNKKYEEKKFNKECSYSSFKDIIDDIKGLGWEFWEFGDFFPYFR